MGSFLRHAGCILIWLSGVSALAQEYPARPIRLIVPIGAGGGTDILARHVAQKLGERFRQAAIVENRPGAGSLIGTEYVAKAAPDGYTLLVGGIFNMVMNRALLRNLPYEPLRDFVPLGYISAYPFVLVARADLPGSSLKELVQYAKERPGKLTYGSAGLGTLQHVWGTILFKSLGSLLCYQERVGERWKAKHVPPPGAKDPPPPPPSSSAARDLNRRGCSGGPCYG